MALAVNWARQMCAVQFANGRTYYMLNIHRRAVATGALCCLASLGGLMQQAQASGFQLREQSAEGLGNAFAGSSAKAQDLSTIFYNPAGMALLDGNGAQGEVAYIMPKATLSGTATRNAAVGGAKTGGSSGGDAGVDTALPSFYAMMSVNPDLKLGLAINTPFGLETNYDTDWVGRYQALRSKLMTMDITPSVAYRLNKQLSIGGGLNLQYISATLTNAVDNRLAGSASDGTAKVKGDDWGAGVNLGVMYEFTPTSRIGLNYRSRVQHQLEGTVQYTNVVNAGALSRLLNSDATAKVTTPDIVSLGAYHEISPQWAVMGEVQYTNWSLFDHLTVDATSGADSYVNEDWKDTYFVSFGATYKPAERWKLQSDIGYDMSPVPEAHRTARIPDQDRLWLSVGAGYQLTPNLALNGAYTHIFVKDAQINETTSFGTLTGSYSGAVEIISASLKATF